MTNTNTAPDANNSLQVAFRLLDEMDYFLESLTENKPIEWTNTTTGIKRSATPQETLADLQDKALFLRLELETLQEKLTNIKAMAREILAIQHEHKADPVVLPVVDLRNKDYPHKCGS